MSYPQLTISANGTQKLSLAPGEWAIQVAGTFGSGTLALKWTDGENTPVAYPDASFTAAGGVIIAVGAADVVLDLSGATNPDINLRAARI